MKRLTEREKELIGIILDYEKEHIRRSYNVAEALGLPANACDMVPFKRIEKALNLINAGDGSSSIIYGYVNGDCSLDDVFEAIDYTMNKDFDSLFEWYERHGL